MCDTLRNRMLITVCCTSYIFVYTGRYNLSIASPLLQSSGIMDKVSIGVMGSIFFFMYAFGCLFNGYLGDRAKPKILIVTGMGISAMCNVLIGLMPPVFIAFALWGINGYFQSMLWGPTLRIVSSVYTDSIKHSKAVMLLSVSVGVGSIVSVVIATLATMIGVKFVFIIPGVLMLLNSIVLFIVLPKPREDENKQEYSIKKIVHNKDLRSMLFPAAAHGVIKDNLTLWIPLFFMEMYHLNLSSVAFYVFMIPFATLVGRIIFPFLYGIFDKNEKTVSIISFGICAAALVPFIIFRMNIVLSALLMAVVAISTSIINASFLSTYPAGFKKNNQVSIVSGVMDFATYIGPALVSPVFGVLISAFGFNSMLIAWLVLAVISIPAVHLSNKSFYKNKDYSY